MEIGVRMFFDNEKKLMRTGLFSSRVEMLFYLLLHFIADKAEPVGAWGLREDLLDLGITCSTATIGRYLKEMDYKEYTIQQSNQGRILTPVGLAHLDSIEERLERVRMQDELSKAVKITEYGELVDLLYVRRALETEAARQAARNATAEDLVSLKRSVDAHKDIVRQNQDPTEPALDFHTVIADISHNKFISSILSMLIYEERKIESVMETLVTRERGRIYVKEHEEIAQAICSHDVEKAASLMHKHTDKLCKAVEEHLKEEQ